MSDESGSPDMDAIALTLIEMEETKRTIVCSPEVAQMLREGGPIPPGITLVESEFLPPDTAMILDENAVEASMRQAAQVFRHTSGMPW